MCKRLNRVAVENARPERFTTLFYGVLDSTDKVVRYCNAGHIPPILIRQDGTSERLSTGGMVLGVFSDAEYAEAEVSFVPGDRLVLITDGINEAMNNDKEEFGEDRLIRLLREHRQLSATELRRILLDSVSAFAGQPLQDDATLMIVSR